MGFLDKVVEVLGFVDKEEDDEQVTQTPQPKPMVAMAAPKPEAKQTPKFNNVVSFNNNKQDKAAADANARVVLVEPVRFEESQSIADNLLEHKAVVINIESCDTDIAAKIIDFVGGVIYAIDGTIQKVSQGIILAAPQNIDIASELKNSQDNTEEEIFAWISQYNRRGDF